MKFKKTIATAALALAGVAGMLATSAGLFAQASTLPVVYGVPYGRSSAQGSNFINGKIRPTGMLMWTGDGSGWFTINSWSSWTGSNAWGSATVHVRSCWGACRQYATEQTTLHFYQVSSHNGQHYFTRLHFSLAHKVAGLGSSTLQFYSHGNPAWYY